MAEKITVSNNVGTPEHPLFIFKYYHGLDSHNLRLVKTKESAYPVQYQGSVVPMGFRCTNCGGAVITDWLYYYGADLHPTHGEWGGECLDCKAKYTVSTMKQIMANPELQYHPPIKPPKVNRFPKGKLSSYATTINSDGEYTKIWHYYTAIVQFTDNKIILKSDGWMTFTTKKKMNQASEDFNLGFQVYQKDFTWYVKYKGEIIPFQDNMCLNRN